MKRILSIFPLVLLFIACNTIESNPDEPKNMVQPSVKISSQNITPLDEIKATYKLRNYATEKVTYGFNSSCQTSYTIKRNSEVIYDQASNIACLGISTALHIKPLKTKKIDFSIHWSQFDQPLENGTYTLEVFLRNENRTLASTKFVVK